MELLGDYLIVSLFIMKKFIASILSLLGISSHSEAQPVDASSILYTTPTLNDYLPGTFVPNVPKEPSLQLHEDDWRQFEFISLTYATEIKKELESIDNVWRNSAKPLGEFTAFSEVHVRRLIPTPVSLELSVEQLEELLHAKSKPVSFLHCSEVLSDVRAIESGNIVFYMQSNGRTWTLAIHPLGPPNLSPDIAAHIEYLMKKEGLALVHWRSRTMFESADKAVEYMKGKS